MADRDRRQRTALAVAVAGFASLIATSADAQMPGSASGPFEANGEKMTSDHAYAGLWVTEDGHIRHELLPTGRYVEARGKRERAYEGQYWVTGDHIDYKDDTGFTADGDFRNGILYHGGMVLYRR